MSPVLMTTDVSCGAKGVVCGDDVLAKQAEDVVVDFRREGVPRSHRCGSWLEL